MKQTIFPQIQHILQELKLTQQKKVTKWLSDKKKKTKEKKNVFKYKKWRPKVKDETKETTDVLEEIASHNPGKNALNTAKKISDKSKKIRDTKKYKIPDEIVKLKRLKRQKEK